MTDQLLKQLTERPQRIRDILRRLHWTADQFRTAVAACDALVELHTMNGCGCNKISIGGEVYTHIARKK